MIVIADTSPLNYLILIGEQEILPALFNQIIIPETVFRELQAIVTPEAVRKWVTSRSRWLEIRETTKTPYNGIAS